MSYSFNMNEKYNHSHSAKALRDKQEYNHREIEAKWQKIWKENKLYETPDQSGNKPNFYTLVEFPYPSGNLHIGHWYAFAVPDIFARTKRMQGYNVMYPIGFDAFGLPAENAAIKRGLDPRQWTYENIAYMEDQLRSMGASFDWSRKVITSDPEYYRWTQWLFLKLYEKGLAYKKKASVNWCPSCQTVLANEQVIAGKCERCGTEVVQKELEQWFFKITDYAERLLSDLDNLKWPEPIKDAQRNWIGKSEGAEIEFSVHPTPTLPQGEGDPKFYTTDRATYRELQDRVVEMRKNPTKAENILWQALRHNATGHHFRRQWIIGRFIVDFTCLEKKLVIEVDGGIHDNQKQEDEERTAFLVEKGFKVIRFKNEEVLDDTENVIKEIYEVLKALPLGEGLGGVVSVFTTRADTLFGATYVVLAPEHSVIENLKFKIENWNEVEKYIKEVKNKTEIERTSESREKTGIRLDGVTAINPATGEEIPVWVADYVLANYGTGAVMAVPAHDERDFAFAKKYGLPVKQVIAKFSTAGSGEHDAVREDKKTVRRKTAYALVWNRKENKFLCLDWEKFGWHSGVIGGVDEGESYEDAAKREIREETGYTNVKFLRELGGEQHNHFFAKHKDENRYAFGRGMLFELVDESIEPLNPEDTKNHKPVWIEANQMENWLNLSAFQYMWQAYKNNSETFVGEGKVINSGEFNDLDSEEAREKIAEKFGKKVTKYKLRDWLLSRQRYWGCPIPVVYDPEGKAHPIPEENLPWMLPEDNIDFTPKGESPLASSNELKERVEKIFGKGWTPEYDTMDTFVDSSWYFLTYCIRANLKSEIPISKQFQNSEIQNKLKMWMPVRRYSGGAEHTTMHLLYARFFHKALFDLGLVNEPEPFVERMNRGLIMGPDGAKMSKSKGNVIDPDEQVAKVGSDTVKMYLAFIGPYNEVGQYPWDLGGVVGIRRFLERVWKVSLKVKSCKTQVEKLSNSQTLKLENLLHRTIKKVTEDIEAFKFNTAISCMMIFVNELEHTIQKEEVSKTTFDTFLKLLAPFAPHITEEIWSAFGNKESIHLEKWPEYDASKIRADKAVIVVQINGKIRAQFEAAAELSEADAKAAALLMPEVQKWLKGQEIKKVIFVPNKIINFVV